MSKSVYSIVLDDDVVSIIDILAAKQGTSRSNMINRILAQHTSLPTAETMLSDVYHSMDEFLSENSSLALQLLGNGSIINMRSALQYKYNPSIKYTVEIYEKGDYIGQLKISMRSQNKQLINILDSFFYLWAKLEMSFAQISEDEFSFNDGKYRRYLRAYDCNDYSNYGNDIAQYIDLLDKCLKEYFNFYPISTNVANQNVKRLYANNITKNIIRL